jgi:D-hexose-6-phosphate mutarotase
VCVYLLGATVTSWVYKEQEQLFLSSKAVLAGPKAIRGGIPLVFPQFGPSGPLPQHGFARVSYWTFAGIVEDTEQLAAQFTLEPSQIPQEQKSLWNYRRFINSAFKLVYTITLRGGNLTTRMQVHNTGTETFPLHFLFHTYLLVKDVSSVQILGLDGCNFDDSAVQQTGTTSGVVTIGREVDRVYTNVTNNNLALKDTIAIEKHNLPDVVVWNPWIEKAKALKDLGDNEYTRFVCVEAGSVHDYVQLQAGNSIEFSQTLSPWDSSKHFFGKI